MGEWFSWLTDKILDIVLFVPRLIMSVLADAVEAGMEMIPTVDGLDMANALSGITGEVLYFMTLLELDFGLTVVFGALIARFVVRRIPVIG